ncbi:hypothetical protein LTR84_004198 [Exophiala bonariae]|uniref:Myb-like domain-containing protein n=1 Tax=Exophiala bonariae TaxID=1690606 RepID=A0AAV9N5Y5_9EURO|nr:hypothetical protein LTR84_004198 [Exophiala bonariae]
MTKTRVWDSDEKLVLLETVLLTLGSPVINGDKVVEQWLGDGPAPSARSIREHYRAIIRVAEAKAGIKSGQPKAEAEAEAIKKSEGEDDKGSLVLTTPISKVKLDSTKSKSASGSGSKRSANAGNKGKSVSAKKRKWSSDPEDEAEGATTTDSDDNIVTPSKRVLPSRRSRKTTKVIDNSGYSEDDGFKDDAEKDFGGVGDDAEYGVESA